MRTTSVTVIINFRKYHSESYIITAMFKVCSQQLRATFTTAFWKKPESWRFYGHGSTYLLILFLESIIKGKSAKVPWKLPVAQKSEPALRKTLHQYRRWSFTYFNTLLLLFNKSTFEFLSSVDWIIFARINLTFSRFTFTTLWILKFIQCLNAFFKRTDKTLMRLNVLFFWSCLQPQNVFITFLFSMKYLYLASSKTTPDVNNSLWFLHVVQDLGDSLHVDAPFGVWLWPQLNGFCSFSSTCIYRVIVL